MRCVPCPLILQVLSLLSHLLPAVPESPRVVADQLPALQAADADEAAAGRGAANRGSSASGGRGGGSGGSRAAAGAGEESGSRERARYLQEHEGVMRVLCVELLPLLLQLYAATVMPQVGYKRIMPQVWYAATVMPQVWCAATVMPQVGYKRGERMLCPSFARQCASVSAHSIHLLARRACLLIGAWQASEHALSPARAPARHATSAWAPSPACCKSACTLCVSRAPRTRPPARARPPGALPVPGHHHPPAGGAAWGSPGGGPKGHPCVKLCGVAAVLARLLGRGGCACTHVLPRAWCPLPLCAFVRGCRVCARTSLQLPLPFAMCAPAALSPRQLSLQLPASCTHWLAPRLLPWCGHTSCC